MDHGGRRGPTVTVSVRIQSITIIVVRGLSVSDVDEQGRCLPGSIFRYLCTSLPTGQVHTFTLIAPSRTTGNALPGNTLQVPA